MNSQNYTVSFTADQSPEEVFDAINNVRGWWSQAIDGDTDKAGAEFQYHYRDVHRCAFKIAEFEPRKRVVWHVTDNYFNFTEDKSEWKDTDVVIEIGRKGNQTEIRFTHLGLAPHYECYDICSDAWGSYILGSLRDLITKGKGRPNPVEETPNVAEETSRPSYSITYSVDQTPQEVFDAINNVRGWWSEEIEGVTDQLGAEFEFHYRTFHRSTQRITEVEPGRKLVWRVLTSQINFVKDKAEWEGTDIVFEITRKGDKTELRFTHVGLIPTIECYDGCSGAWGFYINESLRGLITTGKGQPARKEEQHVAA